MIFDTFKKTFFSHLHYSFNMSEVLQQTDQGTNQIKLATLKKPEFIQDRIKKLDSFIKDKLTKLFTSVRRAFLELDEDHDGLISAEDIMKQFAGENEINYIDVKKLILDKDTSGNGALNYSDFSRWVGNSIHSV